jgi:hypothetical protein
MELSLIAIVGVAYPAQCSLSGCTGCLENFMEGIPPSYRCEGNAELCIEDIYNEDMDWNVSVSCSVMIIVSKTVSN